MKSINIAIHGFGRIGRCFLRALIDRQETNINVVAISEPSDADAIAHLLQFDSAHGRLANSVCLHEGALMLDDHRIELINQSDEMAIDWAAYNVDVLVDCSGIKATKERGQQLLNNGVNRVVFSQPGEANLDKTLVIGYNEHQLTSDDKLISNASCSTNCIVPILAALDNAFGIEHGMTNTIHSAMHDQPVIDAFHSTDLRKTRSALNSIIPVDTALDIGIDRMMPQLAGRFKSTALRVPTVNVSAIDLTISVQQPVTVEQVNSCLKALSQKIPNIVAISHAALVSCDLNHDSHSAIVDASLTQVSGNMVKMHLWFDNEWGYASRLTDLMQLISNLDVTH